MENHISQVELANMCMIEDKETGKILVLDKVGSSWTGITFPGGHVEQGESIEESTVREMKEETGLDISNLEPCGLVHWSNTKTFERFFVFLFKTSVYSGDLLDSTEEGEVFWVEKEEMLSMALAPNMEDYLKLFFHEGYFEVFGEHSDDYSEIIVIT